METTDNGMRKIRLLGAVSFAGNRVEPGTEMEVSVATAHNLAHRGKATILDAAAPAPVVQDGGEPVVQGGGQGGDHAEQ